MLKFQLLTILFSLFFLDRFTLTGRLVDHQYNPVTFYVLDIYSSNLQKERLSLLRTDTVRHQNGEFNVRALESGYYLLEIDVPDYTGYTIPVHVKDQNRALPEIYLQPSR